MAKSHRPYAPPLSRPRPGALPANRLSEESKRMIAENLRGSSSGLYTIKGQNYLEGDLHQDRITKHSRCEIFIESVDEWLAAEIVLASPGMENRVFSVKYVLPSEEGGQEERIEEEVTPDRLRILADAQGYPMSAFRTTLDNKELTKVNMNAAVVPSTGRWCLKYDLEKSNIRCQVLAAGQWFQRRRSWKVKRQKPSKPKSKRRKMTMEKMPIY